MKKKLKILHVSPTYFSPDSVMGGGERYVLELAKAMASYAEVRVLSFGSKEHIFYDGPLSVSIKKPLFHVKGNIVNPFYLNLYKEFKETDVIHVHQLFTVLTEVSVLWARLLRKPIFITDHGGGGSTYLSRFKISRLASGILAVSQYSSMTLESFHERRLAVYGGVDEKSYVPQMSAASREKKIITFGRLLPHKGFHHLIRAIGDEELTIIGQPHDQNYLQRLRELASGKRIRFLHGVDDETLRREIAASALAVFPSTNIGASGEHLSGRPELLGIAPLEAMSMNIPTLVSNIGAYPEVCMDKGIFMYEHDNVEDLKEKINFVLGSEKIKELDFKEHVRTKFTWDKASLKCLEFYREHGELS